MHCRSRGQSDIIFSPKKLKIHDLPYLFTSCLEVDPFLGQVIKKRQQLQVENLQQPQLGAYNAFFWRFLSHRVRTR